MAERVEVRLNKFDIRRFSVRATTKVVEKVTKEIVALAKIEARGPYSTGHLASTIGQRVWVVGSTVRAEITVGAWYATIAHNGARPHPIHPIDPNGYMRFFWRKVGHVVYFKRPHIRRHPGYAGKHYLSGPAERVGRRNRFIVVTYG